MGVMARFLSAAWFDELEESRREAGEPGGGAEGEAAEAVIEQVVTGAPEGEVRYQVVTAGRGLRVRHPAEGAAPLTFTSDYATAASIARGELSTQTALLDGRLRVSGTASGLAERIDELTEIDLVPAGLRATTTF